LSLDGGIQSFVIFVFRTWMFY